MYQNGFNSNFVAPLSGFESNNVVTQQLNKRPTFKRPYDYDWSSKSSQNGEFKYGLFECCSGPNGCLNSTCAIIFCFIPFPGWVIGLNLNGEVADVVGKLKIYI